MTNHKGLGLEATASRPLSSHIGSRRLIYSNSTFSGLRGGGIAVGTINMDSFNAERTATLGIS